MLQKMVTPVNGGGKTFKILDVTSNIDNVTDSTVTITNIDVNVECVFCKYEGVASSGRHAQTVVSTKDDGYYGTTQSDNFTRASTVAFTQTGTTVRFNTVASNSQSVKVIIGYLE